MPFEAIVHEALWRELPPDEREDARMAMRGIARLTHPSRSPQTKALSASGYDRSYRLRHGRYRILFIIFPDEGAIVFTTAFLKRRESDYVAAIARHDARVRAYE